MLRLSVPGGGAFTREAWRAVDEVSRRYTVGPENRPSIRLTMRQNVRFHRIKKRDLVRLVAEIAETGLFALNGCGDNVRNVVACPMSRFRS